VHLGQAGCQVGMRTWELFCEEHGITKDGKKEVGKTEDDDTTYESFFARTSTGQHVPRAVFVDTEKTTIDEISAFSKGLFHPEQLMGYKQDCKNNYFEGVLMAKKYHIGEDVMEQLRKQCDVCNNLQGFFIFNSCGGGTGSGVGTDVVQRMRDIFEKKVIYQPLIFPSRQLSSSIVEPYNSVFATYYTQNEIDVSLMLDNAASYRMCQKNLEIQAPHFTHVNRLIAQCISCCTASLRYESELNASLQDIVTNLVPQKPFRYPIVTLAPVRKEGRDSHETFTTPEIVAALFEERNLMCDCSHLNQNRYLAAVVLLRGDGANDHGTDKGASSASTTKKVTSLGYEPIQVNAVKAALANLKNPQKSHQRAINFVPWTDGFKVGVVSSRPHVVKGFAMAKTPRQGVMIGNNTAVRQLLVRQYQKYCKLFYHKAYVWQFLESSGEVEIFEEAREGFRSLIDEYEKLLDQCADMENQESKPVTLVGRTKTGLLPNP